jgi:hypothetical protein
MIKFSKDEVQGARAWLNFESYVNKTTPTIGVPIYDIKVINKKYDIKRFKTKSLSLRILFCLKDGWFCILRMENRDDDTYKIGEDAIRSMMAEFNDKIGGGPKP